MNLNLELIGVEDAVVYERERIVLKAKIDLDIGGFALLRTFTVPGKNQVRSGSVLAYWFQDKKIKAGDFVVLYTRDGQTSEKPAEGGGTIHFFYWGQRDASWIPGTAPVLIQTQGWSVKMPVSEPVASGNRS